MGEVISPRKDNEALRAEFDGNVVAHLERFYTYAQGQLSRYNLNADQNKDIVQAAYLKILNYFTDYPSKLEEGDGIGLMLIVIKQMIIDQIRRRQNRDVPHDPREIDEWDLEELHADWLPETPLPFEDEIDNRRLVINILDQDSDFHSYSVKPEQVTFIMQQYLLGHSIDTVAEMFLDKFPPETTDDHKVMHTKARQLVGRTYTRTIVRAKQWVAANTSK